MLYLIGVNHSVQRYGSKFEKSGLRACLDDLVVNNTLGFIAEECSEEAVQSVINPGGISTIQKYCQAKEIEHFYVDPDSETRKNLGIPSEIEIQAVVVSDEDFKRECGDLIVSDGKLTGETDCFEKYKKLKLIEMAKYFLIRENYWLNSMLPYLLKDGVFICGSNHLSRFRPDYINEGGFDLLLSDKGIKYSIVGDYSSKKR